MRCRSWLVMAGLMVAGAGAWAQTPVDLKAQPAFEVTVARRSAHCDSSSMTSPEALQFRMTNVPMSFILSYAFDVRDYQIVGEPKWADSDCYEVSGKAEHGAPLDYAGTRSRLQRLLADRFGLTVHHETQQLQGYELGLAKGGVKLMTSAQAAATGGTEPNGLKLTAGGTIHAMLLQNGLRANNFDMDFFSGMLAHVMGQPVNNKTGLTAKYDVKLSYAPLRSTAESDLPSVFTALEEEMGLRLEPKKVPVEMVVIDHLEKTPTEN